MSAEVASQWLDGMLSVSLQFTVLVGVVALLLAVLRPLTPRVRYLVWLIVLLRLALPAGITSPFGVLPPSTSPTGVVDSHGGIRSAPKASPGTSSSQETITSSTPKSSTGASTPLTVFTAWAGIVIFLVGIHLARSVRRRRRVRSAMAPLPPKLHERIEAIRHEVGIRRGVSAWVVEDDVLGGPAIQGFLRPRLLLPAALVRNWHCEELDSVLLHEMVHLKRWDPMARALGNLLQIFYFFHPAVWWVNRCLREEREKACDDAVVQRLGGKKSLYMRSLLRLVEEQPPSILAPVLRMVTAKRPLARRLQRMLQPKYNPNPKLGFLPLSGLILGVGLGFALSMEAGSPTEGQLESESRIYATMWWRDAFFAESIDELEGSERIRLTGDFTLGEPMTPWKPDADRLAAEDPRLFDRLKELGRLSCRFFVNPQGHVVGVRCSEEVAGDLQKPFLDVLNAARFEPTVHYDRGPVMVEGEVDYLINPKPERRSLYDTGQPLIGDEVVEVSNVVPDSDTPLTWERPRYIKILEKGDLPVLEATDEEFIWSFILTIDGSGNVESAEPDPPPDWPDDPTVQPPAELLPYVETFRFEPVLLDDGLPVRVYAMLDLRLSTQGLQVATRAAGSEEELDRRFSEVYRLEDGQNLDLLPPPHPPERMLFYRTGSPRQARAIPSAPDQMIILWQDGRPMYRGSCGGCNNLLDVLYNIGFPPHTVRFEETAERILIETDIIMREGAPRLELLAELGDILKEKFDLSIGFEATSEPTKTLVLRGTIGTIPLDDVWDGARVLHVFTHAKNEDRGGGSVVDAEDLAEMLAYHLGMPVVDETSGSATEPYEVLLYDSAYYTTQADLLIQNLEAQTDLDIVIDQRPQQMVAVIESQS